VCQTDEIQALGLPPTYFGKRLCVCVCACVFVYKCVSQITKPSIDAAHKKQYVAMLNVQLSHIHALLTFVHVSLSVSAIISHICYGFKYLTPLPLCVPFAFIHGQLYRNQTPSFPNFSPSSHNNPPLFSTQERLTPFNFQVPETYDYSKATNANYNLCPSTTWGRFTEIRQVKILKNHFAG